MRVKSHDVLGRGITCGIKSESNGQVVLEGANRWATWHKLIS